MEKHFLGESERDSMLLQVKNISCSYDDHEVVREVDFTVVRGERVCLLGPSGCGKTTILRAIAGLHNPFHGEIRINNKVVFGEERLVPIQKRRVGMVFQDHALFPHLSVQENVAAGLWAMGVRERGRVAGEFMEMMGIDDLSNRFPHELSGGQQQRVALARALAPRPLLLLMDEPFSSLDLDMRFRMSQEISDLLKTHDITCVMVTHDQQDAFVMGDKIGVISDGRLLQWGEPHNVYHQPACRLVADFIGDGAFIDGVVRQAGKLSNRFVELNLTDKDDLEPGDNVDILVRPEDVIHDDSSAIKARVLRRSYKGAEILYTLALNSETTILASLSSHSYFSVGDEIGIRFQFNHVVVFKK